MWRLRVGQTVQETVEASKGLKQKAITRVESPCCILVK
ncbi:hypothetical protein SynWH8103_01809 [Synechococcus sp. WH 8103]|nr:hypothetical protein SynWH8103_01809 [Synechococcus sp. WH 8103]